jgi:2-polyprenyl-6-methoxyphenol hydroxylase-like FAD-dependent oxidoreductase
MTNKNSFGIVGGGIAGLTLAIALQKNGHQVRVYENTPVFRSVGAGIVLAANAMKALRSLGLEDDVLRAGKELKQFLIRDAGGKILTTTDATKINEKFGLVNTLTLHRADLHDVLLRHLSDDTVLLNKRCVDFDYDDDKVKLIFQDGSSTTEDYVIAADGIHSVFRSKLLPLSSLRYSGYTCWRAVVDNVPGTNQGEASETWGRGKRFGIVPLSDDRIYWYATVSAKAGDEKVAAYTTSDLQELFDGFHSPIQEIIGRTSENKLIRNDISDVVPLKQFAFGRVVLTGDAAHATTPNLGQGACMSIEDAVVLANCIGKMYDPQDAFKAFERLRIDRTTRIVNASYSMGKVAQLGNPLLVQLRNLVMRFTPESVAEKQLQFLYDVTL